MIGSSLAGARAQIGELVGQANAEYQTERRNTDRHPFFKPVSIATAKGNKRYSAFSRDISATGMGFLHNMPLDLGRVTVTIHEGDSSVCLAGDIVWCEPSGEGWYTSGMQFGSPD